METLYDLEAIYNQEDDGRLQWLVPYLVPWQGRTILYGHGGIGKTRLVYDLAAAASNPEKAGLCWGMNKVTMRVKTLIVAGEGDPHTNMTRIKHAMIAQGVRQLKDDSKFKDSFYFLPATYLLDDAAEGTGFVNLVKGLQPGLIILDPLDSFFSGDENSVKETKKMRRLIDGLVIDLGCSVILIHHAAAAEGKAGPRKPRGTTAWFGWADSILRVATSPKDKSLVISVEKQRNGPSKFAFKVAPVFDAGNEFIYFRALGGPLSGTGGEEGGEGDSEKVGSEGEEEHGGADAAKADEIADDVRKGFEEELALQHAILAFLRAMPKRRALQERIRKTFKVRKQRLVEAVGKLRDVGLVELVDFKVFKKKGGKHAKMLRLIGQNTLPAFDELLDQRLNPPFEDDEEEYEEEEFDEEASETEPEEEN